MDNDCFCPGDCESTKYIFEVSVSPRSPNDTALLIKSYSKKNKLMHNVKNQIENLDDMCVKPDEKEKRIQELKQLNHSIAYSSTVLHFSWNIETITSYKRDRRYTIEDMLCKLHGLLFKRNHSTSLLSCASSIAAGHRISFWFAKL